MPDSENHCLLLCISCLRHWLQKISTFGNTLLSNRHNVVAVKKLHRVKQTCKGPICALHEMTQKFGKSGLLDVLPYREDESKSSLLA
ncbi:hypothetical protein TNIN_4831 [Trichonephila inaurata madagascariensis]|uniref:Uncharacterized protein n=1 Tax=Trichonephila inaurata madagascariensis TaxID=2747483 RepID=A0A8X7BZV4_9ARAC|nr:hypothetical protein TNIN_4831 [Trichonephila inaurata madagascariensis]